VAGASSSRDEISDMLREFDADGDGKLDFDEFIQIMSFKNTDADIREGFNAIDLGGTGLVSPVALQTILVGMGFGEEAAQGVMGAAAESPMGISLPEFTNMVHRTPALKIKLTILSRMGALWIKSSEQHHKSNVRYRSVVELLENEANRVSVEGGHGAMLPKASCWVWEEFS
jgi:hypothetical protein